jgi:chemotaxis protein methyltransferase CheR
MELNSSLFSQKLSQADFNLIRKEVYDYCGINIGLVKKQMVEGRLRRRIKSLKMSSYDEYCRYVFKNGGRQDEFIHLIDAITTNKTEFFREPAHFSYLSQHILPTLLRSGNGRATRPLQVWSAACSTGQEPYSCAIELAEFSRLQRHFTFQVYATDICTNVLKLARKAVYPSEATASIPQEIMKRYLLKSRDRTKPLVRIAPEIRKVVRFQRLNLKDKDYGIKSKMDVIFCRNVIIYFDTTTQQDILARLSLHLRKGGYLFLGHSESIHGMDLPVRSVSPTVYERI